MSTPSVQPVLLKLEPSWLLRAWWIGLHLLILGALLMVNPVLAGAGGPFLALHAVLRRPRSAGLILICGRRFALPAEGRFDLEITDRARIGHCCARLVFGDRPASPVFVLRDQLDAKGWRRLLLALAGSG